MSSLPKLFCIPFGNNYKLFMNTYDSPESRVDVIWPIRNIEPGILTIRLTNSDRHRTSIKKWNNSEVVSLSWKFSGSNIKILIIERNITVTAAILSINEEDKDKLPFNTCTFRPIDDIFIDEIDTTVYKKADAFTARVATVPSAPVARVATVPSAPIATAPIATAPIATAPIARAPVTTSSKNPLPPHIIKLVLANSISKNESCPISCEAITLSNATVTSCGHVFTTGAIKHWLSLPSSKGECPICKQVC